MERILPMLWTMFGFALASAFHLPKPGAGGLAGFCATALFIVAAITEVNARRR